jgi:hypothetical protein
MNLDTKREIGQGAEKSGRVAETLTSIEKAGRVSETLTSREKSGGNPCEIEIRRKSM